MQLFKSIIIFFSLFTNEKEERKNVYWNNDQDNGNWSTSNIEDKFLFISLAFQTLNLQVFARGDDRISIRNA